MLLFKKQLEKLLVFVDVSNIEELGLDLLIDEILS
jgi:hypothetical protein